MSVLDFAFPFHSPADRTFVQFLDIMGRLQVLSSKEAAPFAQFRCNVSTLESTLTKNTEGPWSAEGLPPLFFQPGTL